MVNKKVQVVIFRKQLNSWEVLLLQTNVRRGEFWQNVTGSLEDVDQQIVDGAFREVLEETSMEKTAVLKFSSLPLEYKFRDQWQRDVEEFTFCFVVESNAKVKIDSSEHQNYQWIKCDMIKKDHYKYPSNFEVFEAGLNWVKQND